MMDLTEAKLKVAVLAFGIKSLGEADLLHSLHELWLHGYENGAKDTTETYDKKLRETFRPRGDMPHGDTCGVDDHRINTNALLDNPAPMTTDALRKQRECDIETGAVQDSMWRPKP